MGSERLEALVLRDRNGQRKYLNQAERELFFALTNKLSGQERAFCKVLYFTGCRISEALALKAEHLDLADQVVIIETLKRRRRGFYRAVPVPLTLLQELKIVGGLDRLFGFSRTHAWRVVKSVMHEAGIQGVHGTAKGLRHGFGIAHAAQNTPLNLIQKWLGHASSETTKVYLDAVGEEERTFAKRVW
jgi:integrase